MLNRVTVGKCVGACMCVLVSTPERKMTLIWPVGCHNLGNAGGTSQADRTKTVKLSAQTQARPRTHTMSAWHPSFLHYWIPHGTYLNVLFIKCLWRQARLAVYVREFFTLNSNYSHYNCRTNGPNNMSRIATCVSVCTFCGHVRRGHHFVVDRDLFRCGGRWHSVSYKISF